MTLEGHLESFKAHLEHAGASERTVDCYVRHAREFVAFLGAYYPRVSRWNQIGKDIVRDYQTYLSQLKGRGGRPQANTSLRLKLSALKKLFGYLLLQDLVLKDPTSVIVSPKEEQRLVRDVLTEAEILELLRKVKPRDPVSIRNRAPYQGPSVLCAGTSVWRRCSRDRAAGRYEQRSCRGQADWLLRLHEGCREEHP